MTKFLWVLFTTILLTLPVSQASAQTMRTWVSGVGDDANTCSRTAPCKTFAGAISKTPANGEINCLDPAGYGTVTITKSITIDCHEALGSIIGQGANAINIAFDSFGGDVRKTVNLRNLMIQGADTGLSGINISGAGAGSIVNVQDCLIDGIYGNPGAGIIDSRGNGVLTVVNTTVRNVGGAGIQAQSSGGLLTVTLVNDQVLNALVDIAVGTGAAVHVGNSTVSNSGAIGAAISGGGLNIDSSTLTFNAIGIKQSGGSVYLANSALAYNSAGVSGTVNSYRNNRFTGNGGGGTIVPVGSQSDPTGLQ